MNMLNLHPLGGELIADTNKAQRFEMIRDQSLDKLVFATDQFLAKNEDWIPVGSVMYDVSEGLWCQSITRLPGKDMSKKINVMIARRDA